MRVSRAFFLVQKVRGDLYDAWLLELAIRVLYLAWLPELALIISPFPAILFSYNIYIYIYIYMLCSTPSISTKYPIFFRKLYIYDDVS